MQSVSPGLVQTDWWASSGLDQQYSDELYHDNPSLNVDDVAEAVMFALSRPPHVQVRGKNCLKSRNGLWNSMNVF